MHYRNTWAQIDLDNFEYNLNYYRNLSNKDVMVVLKANAYGHGDLIMAEYAQKWGFNHFAVSSLEEAIRLRENGINGLILVLGPTGNFRNEAVKYDITLTIPSLEYVSILPGDCNGLKVFLAVDTGMNRIGFKNLDEVKEAFDLLINKQADVMGIFSHYATSDNQDSPLAMKQLERFKEFVNGISYKFPYVSLSNSDGISWPKEDFTNLVRLGIGAYGYSTYEKLKPCLSLYTTVSMIKEIKAGEKVGYGATYTADKDTWIATVPIGYADGWLRSNQNRNCIIHSREQMFAGRICMDQCMISCDKKYPIGTTVELIGDKMPLERVAKENNTIVHEILTNLSGRVYRIYTYHKKIVREDSGRFNNL